MDSKYSIWPTFWVAVGSVAGTLLLVFVVYQFIQGRPHLQARGEISAFSIPDQLATIDNFVAEENKFTELATGINAATIYMQISVKNVGSETIKDLRFNAPLFGAFSTSTKNRADKFNRKIELGELRPSESLKLLIWTNGYFNEEEVVLNFEKGSEIVDFGSRVYGIWGWVVPFLMATWVPLLLLFFALIFIISTIGVDVIDRIEKNKNRRV